MRYLLPLKANKDSPEFSSTYNNTEQKIDVTFTSLEVLLHQEALLHILELVEKLKPAPKTTEEIPSGAGGDGEEKEKAAEEEANKKIKSNDLILNNNNNLCFESWNYRYIFLIVAWYFNTLLL